jgi:Ni,Fe-hydrogenase III large subunit
MTGLANILPHAARVERHRPWPRLVATEESWRNVAREVATGHATLLGLWGDMSAAPTVHMAIVDDASGDIAVVRLPCPAGKFPSVGALHPPAIRLERAIQSLFGFAPEGASDVRPWLDLGFWDVSAPLGARTPAPATKPAYPFLPVDGEGLHQIPVGPVHAGIIEPGHFRFTANGETIVRLEERLGYVHKGIESLMAGASIAQAAKLASRTSGDSTVAYAFAFARAVEAALGIEVPPRAVWLRALMAELERLANHLGDIGAICNDAAFALMHAHCAVLREHVLRAAAVAFGHRLMMDCIVAGGVGADLTPEGAVAVRLLLTTIRSSFPALIELYDNTASLQDRTVSTGTLDPALARRFGAGGHVGRASGRGFDSRRTLAYPPYDSLRFEVPVRQDGDVNARVWIRIREVEQSLGLVEQILERLPPGEVRVPITGTGAQVERADAEGMAIVEAFRGDVLVWVRLDGAGQVARCHLRDPSWFQWPLLEAAIAGNIVADFPLCNKSFNCSYSGHDL